MKSRTSLAILFALLASACSKHPLDGGWKERTEGTPRVLQFDVDSDQLLVHAHGRTDGGAEHMHGTWSQEGERIAVRWDDDGKSVSLQGKKVGDLLELADKDGKAVVFERGASAH